ncbi:adenylyltransferase/cytidyltransferase family protein [Campylobacter jejuni]|uniref:Adenylyltransferase/cytidyltransferase family protein n=1 Tax=Campylobacter jejuni TaxID=197 RepID=A0A690V8J4_CAMJU|nr:adenylyltransferase/cytidyltransferase family protein [Campylobacter jejuni]EAJ5193932.1 glycerol-3-phosphate cytidylyltransferase [Campylobacter jejuni]EAK0573796.1 glycerol-3-phosphate cytidylyltransferase [Campylobacter jejuni]EDP7703142.1 adenylyltransferase/cytidyltransferase family protein [Campylobacter jejuni]EDP8234486.1 adenylyltransferase/cytidyltransferase family protein [Campylobacter jejuni]EFV4333888.1 adenylyltransferase/cytidyltransferase family protein [Campylobacter jejun
MKNVITFGTFDLFHYGHLRILERAASLGNKLIVGVSSDSLNFAKKHRYPIYSEQERLNIISSLKCVSCVFLEEALELKRDYLLKYQANILVMGDDWKGKFDCFNDICDVIYFERTPSISTTEIIERIKL